MVADSEEPEQPRERVDREHLAATQLAPDSRKAVGGGARLGRDAM